MIPRVNHSKVNFLSLIDTREIESFHKAKLKGVCECEYDIHCIEIEIHHLTCILFLEFSSYFIQGVPKKMFPCLRGYNSCKKGTTVKSKVSFEILRQFSF